MSIEPSDADFRLAERLVSHQGTSVRRLAQAFRDVRAAAARAPSFDDEPSFPSGLQHLLDALDDDATALHLAGAIHTHVASAVAAERERCEQLVNLHRHPASSTVAAAIRDGEEPAALLSADDVVRRVRDRMAADFFLHPAEAAAEVTRFATACRVLAVAAPRRTAEQFARAVVHEYGSRWTNEHPARPAQRSGEQTRRQEMALACVLGALSELELPWLAQLEDPPDDLLAAVLGHEPSSEVRLELRRVLHAAGEHLRAKP